MSNVKPISLRFQTVAALLGLGAFFFPIQTQAVVFLDPGGLDSSHNTIAPTGILQDSGWQFSGDFLNFLAYPIAPEYFIAAAHIGGGVGNIFVYNSVSYSVTEVHSATVPVDLNIFRVNGTFPNWTPLYSNSDEIGKEFVVFGKGAARGMPISGLSSDPNVTSELKGWEWGTTDFQKRWGQNKVSAAGSDPILGQILQADFDRNDLTEEATLSAGDSSGGVFIKDGSVWKLAGVNCAVEASFNFQTPGTNVFSSSGTSNFFFGAIFDQGGLYRVDDASNILDLETDLPAAMAATRISANLPWINSVIGTSVPEPTTWMLPAVMVCLVAISTRRRNSRRT